MIVWKRDERQYTSGYLGYLGKYIVCGIHYDATKPRGSELNWKATCKLPGIKGDLGNFVTEKEAKDRAELAVNVWIGGTKLQEKS